MQGVVQSLTAHRNITCPRTCNHKRKLLPTRPIDVDTSLHIAVKTSGKQLHTKLDHVKSWVDADETESSSGERAVTKETTPSHHTHKLDKSIKYLCKYLLPQAAEMNWKYVSFLVYYTLMLFGTHTRMMRNTVII